MFKIREEQNEAFRLAALKGFEDRMLMHLSKYFPIQSEVLGEAQLREVVRYGSKKAANHGFTTQRNVAIFLTLMPMLGSNFDEDVQLPWASEILNDVNIDAGTRADRLADKAREFHTKAIGDDSQYVKNLIRYRAKRFEDLLRPATGSLEDQIIIQAKSLYAEKYHAIGDENTRRLIRYGRMSAETYGMTSDRNVTIHVAMMYVLGSGFCNDPIYPWAGKVLEDTSIKDEDARADRLFKEATLFFDKWLVCLTAGRK